MKTAQRKEDLGKKLTRRIRRAFLSLSEGQGKRVKMKWSLPPFIQSWKGHGQPGPYQSWVGKSVGVLGQLFSTPNIS